MPKKVYQITEQQCRAGINGVCPRCGGEVTPMETEDNAHNPTFWSGCEKCEAHCEGVSLQVYEIAETLVEEGTCDRPYYEEDDSAEFRAYKLGETIYPITGIVRRVVWLIEEERKANAPVSDDAKAANYWEAMSKRQRPKWVPSRVNLPKAVRFETTSFGPGAFGAKFDGFGTRIGLSDERWFLLYHDQYEVLEWRKNEAENAG